jgi:hypothetical protein
MASTWVVPMSSNLILATPMLGAPNVQVNRRAQRVRLNLVLGVRLGQPGVVTAPHLADVLAYVACITPNQSLKRFWATNGVDT